MAYLEGDALTIFHGLFKDGGCDYWELKKQLMHRFRCTKEGFQERFRSVKPNQEEPMSNFCSRMKLVFERWLELCEVGTDFNKLVDLILCEQFQSSVSKDLNTFLKERRCSDLKSMVNEAEGFRLAHPNKDLSRRGASSPLDGNFGAYVNQQNSRGGFQNRGRGIAGNRGGNVGGNFSGRGGGANLYGQGSRGGGSGQSGGGVPGNQQSGSSGFSNSGGRGSRGFGQQRGNFQSNRGCFKCGGPHVAKFCKSQTSFSSVAAEVKVLTSMAAANLPIFEGKVNGRVGSILRDTGANVCGVRRSLVKDSQFLDKKQLVRTFGGRVESFELALVDVDSSLFSGQLECCVLEDPVADVVLGNLHDNFALGDLLLGEACITTRAQARKEEKPIVPLLKSNVPDLNIDRDKLVRLQREDKSLSSLFDSIDSDEKKFENDLENPCFFLRDDVLYRCHVGKNMDVVEQVVVPLPLRDSVLCTAHDGLLAGHGGIKRTLSRVSSSFFWPGMYRDVKQFCRSCDVCQRTVAKGRVPNVPLEFMPRITEPFKRVAIDLAGPFPVSDAGNMYILSIVDVASRFPEAVPLKKIDSASVAEELIKVFARMGFPEEILSDNGSQFTSEMMSEVLRLLSVKAVHTSPYHAQSNGVVERFHGTIKPMLRKLSLKHPKMWDRYLPGLLFACRDVVCESTGFSPFEILYGRRARGPVELLASTWTEKRADEEVKSSYQYVFDLKNMMDDVSKLVDENLLKSAKKNKTYHDKNARDRKFKVGDEVLVLLPSSTNKLLMSWKGPYRVLEVLRSDYRISWNNKVFHANMLKKYNRRDDVSNEAVVCCQSEFSMVGHASMAVLPCADENEVLPIETLSSGGETIENVKMDGELSSSEKDDMWTVFKEIEPVLNPDPGTFRGDLFHRVRTTTSEPVQRRQYPLPFASKEILEKEVETMLSLGVIEPSQSPYCAPVVLVKKKDGSTRVCIDFRELNKVSVLDAEPIPDVEQLFAQLADATYFTKIDLSKGYWQILVHPDDRHKTAFQTPLGLFQWVRMPFGLASAPATFARMMRLLHVERFSASNFFDDILIASKTWKEHLCHLRGVLNCLFEFGLTVRPSKVLAGFRKVEFLGHVVGEGAIRPEESKVQKILGVSTPTTRKQVRSLLGLLGYYRRYVPCYSELTAPMTDLLKGSKGKAIVWTPECAESLMKVQKILSSSPVLSLPDLSREFLVRTDASSIGIGGVLLQEKDGILHPVSFVSRKLLDREQRYGTIERECLAIVWTLDKLSRYLWGQSFVLQTDHKPLTFLCSSSFKNSRIMRWSLALQEFSFEIRPIAGEKNQWADLLSRSCTDQVIP